MSWYKIITENIVPVPRWGATLSKIKQKLYLVGGYIFNPFYTIDHIVKKPETLVKLIHTIF